MFQKVRQNLRPVLSGNAIRMPRYLSAPPGCPDIRLRPLRAEDSSEWNEVRWRNDEWLSPWESGDPMHGPGLTYNAWIAQLRRNEQAGTGVVFAIEHDGRIVGQISIGAICYGAMRTGVVGYWVDRDLIGHGYAPAAVGVLADWALTDPTGPRLHRLEIAVLPENERSLAVARKIGARYEGRRTAYMYVRGCWRDHETFALLAEDAGDGFARRISARHARYDMERV